MKPISPLEGEFIRHLNMDRQASPATFSCCLQASPLAVKRSSRVPKTSSALKPAREKQKFGIGTTKASIMTTTKDKARRDPAMLLHSYLEALLTVVKRGGIQINYSYGQKIKLIVSTNVVLALLETDPSSDPC